MHTRSRSRHAFVQRGDCAKTALDHTLHPRGLQANLEGVDGVDGGLRSCTGDCARNNIRCWLERHGCVRGGGGRGGAHAGGRGAGCLLYTSPSPRDRQKSRMPSSA